MSVTQKCSVYECASKYYQAGYCNKHYLRKRRGSSLEGKTIYDDRESIIGPEYALIPLGLNAKGGYAIIDKEFSWIDKHKWYKNVQGYAVSKIDGHIVRMHRYIKSSDVGSMIDHINQNKIDNRINNLRYATPSQNSINVPIKNNNTSGYKGVYKNHNKWAARITKDRKYIHGGIGYSTREEAAERYNQLAIENYGEYAALNTTTQTY